MMNSKRFNQLSIYLVLLISLNLTFGFDGKMKKCFSVKSPPLTSSLAKVLSTLAIATSLGTPLNAFAASSDIPVYFGVGCFWHVQHEFVSAERNLLQRSDQDLTSLAGYAGGNKKPILGVREKLANLNAGKKNILNVDKASPEDTEAVCYHNALGKAEYDSLGYTEVVGMKIPKDSIESFASEYFSLFGADSERPDKGDRGSEYRSTIGIPGGISSDIFPSIEKALAKSGKQLKLLEGKGNDPDTLNKKVVWVLDSTKFPFKQGELYHQYHDGFMPGEQYGNAYHSLGKLALQDGRIKPTGCPNRDGTFF